MSVILMLEFKGDITLKISDLWISNEEHITILFSVNVMYKQKTIRYFFYISDWSFKKVYLKESVRLSFRLS